VRPCRRRQRGCRGRRSPRPHSPLGPTRRPNARHIAASRAYAHLPTPPWCRGPMVRISSVAPHILVVIHSPTDQFPDRNGAGIVPRTQASRNERRGCFAFQRWARRDRAVRVVVERTRVDGGWWVTRTPGGTCTSGTCTSATCTSGASLHFWRVVHPSWRPEAWITLQKWANHEVSALDRRNGPGCLGRADRRATKCAGPRRS